MRATLRAAESMDHFAKRGGGKVKAGQDGRGVLLPEGPFHRIDWQESAPVPVRVGPTESRKNVDTIALSPTSSGER